MAAKDPLIDVIEDMRELQESDRKLVRDLIRHIRRLRSLREKR